MKDIDFDELDKAVNSLMATAGPDANQVDEKPETVVELSSPAPVAPPVTQPAPAAMPTTATVPVTVSVSSASPAVAPAARRGRFMDMVQKPSQTSGRTAAPVAVAVPSREGLSITPRSEPSPAPVSTEIDVAPSVDPQRPVSFDTMPDPLDMATTETPEVESTIVDSPEPLTSSTAQVFEPIESPFLTDAKVEKRPLNSNLGQELEQAAKEESDSTAEDTSLASTERREDEPPINPQIPELSSDLVAIESGETDDTTQVVDTAAANEVDVPSTPLGATSIAQQYKAKESSGDQSHAAIYDASQYPEPLSHPAKSKSGWLWVLWVIVLLGIGAGGAVLLYTLGIIP